LFSDVQRACRLGASCYSRRCQARCLVFCLLFCLEQFLQSFLSLSVTVAMTRFNATGRRMLMYCDCIGCNNGLVAHASVGLLLVIWFRRMSSASAYILQWQEGDFGGLSLFAKVLYEVFLFVD
jgi:hypothetical protein